VRQQRANVTVEELGPTVLDLTTGHRVAIGSNELLTDEADCAGDSGGPALDPGTGAVIAVASRSGVGASNTGSPCRNSKNVYTAPSGFQSVIAAAFAGSGEEVWVEGSAQPPRLPATSPPAATRSKGGCSVQSIGAPATLEGWLVGALGALGALGFAVAAARFRNRRSHG
jgi:secreted trypsin-like serine protease